MTILRKISYKQLLLPLFLLFFSAGFAQEKDSTLGKPYNIEVGDSASPRVVEYYILKEKKEYPFSSVNPSLVGHILIPEMRTRINSPLLVKAAYAIAAKHRYPLVYFYSDKIAFDEVIRARQNNDWPNESLLRKGFLCKIEKRTFKSTYD